MKLSDFCKKQDNCYMTGYDWFKKGMIPNSRQLSIDTILVDESLVQPKRTVVYCRVSSYQQKEHLDRQIERCKEYCLKKGYAVSEIYKEIASGMNDNRKEFWKMIDSKPTLIIVENKDRLTRFGFNYIEKLLIPLNCKIEVIFPNENQEQELMSDLVSIITSFCCRLYGLRRGNHKANKLKEALQNNDLDQAEN